jgi:DNA-binding transcriptional MerR regulator
MMSKENLRNAFGGIATPIEEALQDKPIEEFTPDQLKLSELGIPIEEIKTITLGWHQKHSGGKKVFHPNNESLENITKGFWNYLLDCIHPVDLLKIDTSLLSEGLEDLTLKQIMNKDRSISDDYQKENDILREQIIQLKKKSQNVINSVEVMEYNQETIELLGWLYRYMGNLDFKKGFQSTQKDIENLQKIEELIK